jgi:hypothetical protein
MRGTGTSRDRVRACAHPGRVCPPIIHHPSSIIHQGLLCLIRVAVFVSRSCADGRAAGAAGCESRADGGLSGESVSGVWGMRMPHTRKCR